MACSKVGGALWGGLPFIQVIDFRPGRPWRGLGDVQCSCLYRIVRLSLTRHECGQCNRARFMLVLT